MEANPYATPQTTVAGESPLLNDPETIRRQYLTHEASVKSVGTLYLLGAIILVFWTLFNVHALVTGSEYAKESAWSLVAFLSVVTVLQFWTGMGLRKLRKPARAVGAIFSAIGLIGIPIGTIISAYILYLLMSKKGNMVFSPEYQQIIEQTPHVKYKGSKVFRIVLIVFGIVILAIAGLVIFSVATSAKGR
jgi:hypothetical protein